jgi:GNAT superfamily N-acetyltransferase
MIVRKITLSDIASANNLIKEFTDEALGEYGFTFNERNIYRMIEGCIDHSFVLEHEGEVVGVLAGFIVKGFSDGEEIYQETIWYVSKKHRRYGIKLLKATEDYVKSIGIKKMMMVHLGNETSNKMQRFYEAMGYRHLETQYIKELL